MVASISTVYRFFIVATTIAIAFSVNADWGSVKKIDDFTDEQVVYVEYIDSGHRLQFSHEGKTVWMFITRKRLGTFAPNGIIELRVDKNETKIIDPESSNYFTKKYGFKPFFQWEPSTVGFRIWNGEEENCGFLADLLKGKELKIRYRMNSLSRDSFDVSLDGLKQHLENSLRLELCGV